MTKTLIPLAAIDDVIGVIVFFTTISIIGTVKGGQAASPLATVGMVILPFVIGILIGIAVGYILKMIKNVTACFIVLLLGLIFCVSAGLIIDYFVFHSFALNYLLIGMSFAGAIANIIDEEKLEMIMKKYSPILGISLLIVIVNLGMPLDYRLIAGAGIFTIIYILSRAAGKIGFSFVGGKVTGAEKSVTKWLGFTLLPHSGVSLVFTGIAASTLEAIDSELASILSGTIVAAAIINEIVAVILAKVAFKKAGEIKADENKINENKSEVSHE